MGCLSPCLTNTLWHGKSRMEAMAAGGKALQCPGDGVAGRLDACGEEEPKLAGQQVVGQGLPGARVSQAQQVCCDAHILRVWRPSGLHLSARAVAQLQAPARRYGVPGAGASTSSCGGCLEGASLGRQAMYLLDELYHAGAERPEQAPRLAHLWHPQHVWPRRVGRPAVQLPECCKVFQRS